jgi:hypothetical protein
MEVEDSEVEDIWRWKIARLSFVWMRKSEVEDVWRWTLVRFKLCGD